MRADYKRLTGGERGIRMLSLVVLFVTYGNGVQISRPVCP